jgi:ureidoglycolate lyase
MTMVALKIFVEPLTRAAFVPFGDVIETDGSAHYTINQGHAERFHDLAHIDVQEAGGKPLISIFRATPWPNPVRIAAMERHPLSSQAFVPLTTVPFLVVVGAPTDALQPEHLRAFVTNGRQGVNYARGVWHHALLALDQQCDFLIVDRGGLEPNCDEVFFGRDEIVLDYPVKK